MEQATNKFPYSEYKLHHIGLVVNNIDKAIIYLESIGIGPFQGINNMKMFTESFKGELNGQPAEWKTSLSFARLGDVELELLEPSEGPQALRESLDATGEGLHHIGFLTDDIDAVIEKGKNAGLEIWTIARSTVKPSFLYFKPTSIGGLAIEFRTP